MPQIRVNAGSRGIGDQQPSLNVLAPLESGWTISEQPNLYFYLSKKPETPVVFALAIPDRTDPVIKLTNLAERIQPGFNRIRLADHGVRLSPGVGYRWSVTVVISPESPSQNIFQEGGIERIDPEPVLVQRMSEARAFDRPRVCLDGSLWYDAIDALMRLRDLDSSNALLREQLASLLARVGLTDVKF